MSKINYEMKNRGVGTDGKNKLWNGFLMIKKFFLYFARGAVGIAKITPIQIPINCRIYYRITIKSIANNLFAINHIIHNKLSTFLLHWWGLLLFYTLAMQKKTVSLRLFLAR